MHRSPHKYRTTRNSKVRSHIVALFAEKVLQRARLAVSTNNASSFQLISLAVQYAHRAETVVRHNNQQQKQ